MNDGVLKAKLDEILAEVRSLRALIEQPPIRERVDDLVDAHYVAARFGCSVRGVQSGAFGTKALPRISRRPLRFRRADVDKLLRELARKNEAPKQRALKLLDRKEPRRKRVA
jgi:hypothetical protein